MKKTSIKNRNASYWERRAAQRMVDYMAEAEKTASDLGQAYYAASESMKDDMHRIFGNFQRAFEISEAEAKRIFAEIGNDNAMKTLREAAMKISDPEKRQLALDALTSAPAYTWRIARLDDMIGNVSETCNRLYNTDLKKTTDFLGEITGTAYNRTVYDLQVGTGTVGAAFDLLPESRINQILKTNWCGKNYSSRIYADVKDMESKLKQTLLESMMTGESEHKIAEKVSERWQIGYNDARRLIRTETNYVSNQAELESYRSAGVKEYTFVAVLDSRTSEICQELDGKRFPVDQAKVGVNLPPMHPYCRSTTIAVIEDDIWEMSDEEIDKLMNEIDEELGLNEDVPFDDWLAGLKETEDGKVKYVRNKNVVETGKIDFTEKNKVVEKVDSESNFVPAKTVEEAEKFAQQYCNSGFMSKTFKGKIDYKGIGLENANSINKALSQVFEKIDLEKISGIKAVSPTSALGKKAFSGGADAVMSYSPLENGIFINKDILKNKKSFEDYVKKSEDAWNTVMNNIDKLSGRDKELAMTYMNAGRDLVDGKTVEGMLKHEIGHHVQWTLIDTKSNNEIGSRMSEFASKISGYANASKSEYFAESFSAYMNGEQDILDPEYVRILKDKLKK